MDIGDEFTDSSGGYAAIGSGDTPIKSVQAAPAEPTRVENVTLGEKGGFKPEVQSESELHLQGSLRTLQVTQYIHV